MRDALKCRCKDRKHTLTRVNEFITQHDLGQVWHLSDWVIRNRFPATKCGKFWYLNSEQEANEWLRQYRLQRLPTLW